MVLRKGAGSDDRREVCNMPIKSVEKSEWLEQIKNSDAVLIGALTPSLSLITVEADCCECGRPIYISTYENSTAGMRLSYARQVL